MHIAERDTYHVFNKPRQRLQRTQRKLEYFQHPCILLGMHSVSSECGEVTEGEERAAALP